MGLLDIFRMGKVIAGTIRAVKNQRDLANEIAALPMERFVPVCLANLNNAAGSWEGRARPPDNAAASLAIEMRLPDELAEFYRVCDGFESVQGEFPACIDSIRDLRLGADGAMPLTSSLLAYWKEYGNDSEKPGLLSVLPPDDLAALATNSAESYLKPSTLDLAVPLCPADGSDFVVILLADSGKALPLGTVLDVEASSATRYPTFKTWLATRASLFGSRPDVPHAPDA